YVQMGIVLEVSSNPVVDINMKVGAVSEQVTVEAGALQVETRTTSIGQVVDNQRIMEMPLNGRNVHQLIFLAGMANFPGTASLNSRPHFPSWSRPGGGGKPGCGAFCAGGLFSSAP